MIAAESCPDRLAHHITPMTLHHTDLEPVNYFYKQPLSDSKVRGNYKSCYNNFGFQIGFYDKDYFIKFCFFPELHGNGALKNCH